MPVPNIDTQFGIQLPNGLQNILALAIILSPVELLDEQGSPIILERLWMISNFVIAQTYI
jgi:hypothetical protein